MDDLRGWADQKVGAPQATAAASPALDSPQFPPGAERVTVDDLLSNPDLAPDVRAWLELYKYGGADWAAENNPPGFVSDEACWEKAKSAGDQSGADDLYAFATWWYGENCGG